MRGRRSYRGRGRVNIGGLPRITGYDKQEVRLERAQLDVRPMLFTIISPGTESFAATTDLPHVDNAQFCIQPLRDLYGAAGDSDQFKQIKLMWNEYRIKKVTLHLMLQNIYHNTDSVGGIVRTNTAPAANGVTSVLAISNNIVVTCWQRNSVYAGNGLPAVTANFDVVKLGQMPQSKVVGWYENTSKPEFWTSITAGGQGESNWLNTQSAPNQNMNIKDFFDPVLNMAIFNAEWVVGTHVQFFCEEEIIVECRGSRL